MLISFFRFKFSGKIRESERLSETMAYISLIIRLVVHINLKNRYYFKFHALI